MHRLPQWRMAIAACLLLSIILAGCTVPVPTATPNAPATETPIAQETANTASPEQSIESSPAVPDALPGETDIAIYPGAKGIEKQEENAPLGRSVYFTTPDAFDKVYDFYKTTYMGKGWKVNDKRITFEDADFIWADDAGAIPWNVGLGLDVQNKVADGTEYVVWVQRQADPDNIPVIEGATDVQVAMSRATLAGTGNPALRPARLITYTTVLAPSDVLDAYKYQMLSYGWNEGSDTSDTVTFSYSYGVPEKMYFNMSVIKAVKQNEGKTLVTVGAAGADTHKLVGPYTPPVMKLAKLLPVPANAPVYPGAQRTFVSDPRSWRTRLFGMKSMDAWTTPDNPQQVKQFYVDTLTKLGWKQVDHPKPNWTRFIYDIGSTCQTRYSLYVILPPDSPSTIKSTNITTIFYLGCYVISGDE